MQVACLRCHPARKPLRRFSTLRRFPPFLPCRTPVRSISDTHPVNIGHRSGPNRTPFRSHRKTVRHQPGRLSDFNRNTVRFESERCPTSNRIGVRFASEYASVPDQRKQMRHWSFILIECWPRRFPFSASSRLPGGSLRKPNSTAASISCSLMSARCQMSPGRSRERPVSHNFSVSRSTKLLITNESRPNPIIRQANNIRQADNRAIP